MNQRKGLAVVAVGMTVVGLFAFLFGEFLFAGLSFLVVSMAIYLRETRD